MLVLACCHFARAASIFTILPLIQFPSIGGLVILAILASLLILPKSVITDRLPRLVALRSLVGTAILVIIVFLVNLVSLRLHVVIVTRPSLISLIFLR